MHINWIRKKKGIYLHDKGHEGTYFSWFSASVPRLYHFVKMIMSLVSTICEFILIGHKTNTNNSIVDTIRVMLTSALGHSLIIYFRKILTSFLWEMKKTVKILIVFFSFSIKTFFNWIINEWHKGTC